MLTDDPHAARALYLRGLIAYEDGDRAAARQFVEQALQGAGEFDRAAAQQLLTDINTPPRTRRR